MQKSALPATTITTTRRMTVRLTFNVRMIVPRKGGCGGGAPGDTVRGTGTRVGPKSLLYLPLVLAVGRELTWQFLRQQRRLRPQPEISGKASGRIPIAAIYNSNPGKIAAGGGCRSSS